MRNVESVKMSSEYYQKYFLTHVFKEDIPLLLQNNYHFVKFHQDNNNYTTKSIAIFIKNEK